MLALYINNAGAARAQDTGRAVFGATRSLAGTPLFRNYGDDDVTDIGGIAVYIVVIVSGSKFNEHSSEIGAMRPHIGSIGNSCGSPLKR